MKFGCPPGQKLVQVYFNSFQPSARVAYNFYALAYSISSAVVTCFTWVVLYWALDEENLRRRRIFRYDTNAKACFTFSVVVWVAVAFIGIAYDIIVHEEDWSNVVCKIVLIILILLRYSTLKSAYLAYLWLLRRNIGQWIVLQAKFCELQIYLRPTFLTVDVAGP